MKRIQLDTAEIRDWDSFHQVFQEAMGFPEFYGRNLDAWIDCMSYLDDPAAGMSQVSVERGKALLLEFPVDSRISTVKDTPHRRESY